MSDSPSPINSLFGNLKQKHEEIGDSLRLRKQIPNWDDPVIVATYRPLEAAEVEQLRKKVNKSKNPSLAVKGLNMAMDTLIAACVSVVAVIDGKEYSFGPDPEGEPTRFDEDMAATLGLEDNTARSVVRFLFHVDGDLLGAAYDINEFSGLSGERTDEEYAGE